MKNTLTMRVLHRYLGYFLAGIMAVYSISGIVLIFRNTDFLKKEKIVERQLDPNIDRKELGRTLKIKNFSILKEEGDLLFFKTGTYHQQTGLARYTKKELPYILDRMTHLHKATTNDPLYWLNISFGVSLLFFVVSAFWMFLPKTKIFWKGIYFTIAGIVLTLLMLFV